MFEILQVEFYNNENRPCVILSKESKRIIPEDFI
jgi:hypothetical protein